MTSSPISLVPKPKVSDEIRASVVGVLREALAQAEAGEVEGVFVVLGLVDGGWFPRMSVTDNFSGLIGKIEIGKIQIVNQYLKDSR